MYESLSNFLTTFSAGNPLLWALMVMAVVAATSLVLYLIGTVVERCLASGNTFKRNRNRDRV